ncbi:MAG: hypothetical protein JW704_01635 [Anaerolineaceae bacterium]|nr:hypothetical protein [Anaerolineaceae bacterium]MBN2677436.1 hypothetical protein [Anaerolineaceae bacterium]
MLQTKERIIIMEPPQKQTVHVKSLPIYIEDHFKQVEPKQVLTEAQRKELVVKLIDFVEAF